MRAEFLDPKGEPVVVDALVQGFIGQTKQVRTGRIYAVSEFGWVAFWDPTYENQYISYPGKFLVREGPRPPAKRTDVPERLRRDG